RPRIRLAEDARIAKRMHVLLERVARAVGRAVVDEDEFARKIAALAAKPGDDLVQEAPLVEHRNDEADAVLRRSGAHGKRRAPLRRASSRRCRKAPRRWRA